MERNVVVDHMNYARHALLLPYGEQKKLAGHARWGDDSLRGVMTTVCIKLTTVCIKLLMVVYAGSFPRVGMHGSNVTLRMRREIGRHS